MASLDDLEDIEIILHASEDQREITLVLRSPKKISLNDFIIELEQYIMELSRAEEQKQGSSTH